MKRKLIQPNIYQYEKLLLSLECIPKRFVDLAIQKKLNAIKHLPGKENLINLVWKRCLMVFIIMIKSKIIRRKTLFTVVSHQENKWMILLDKLNSLNHTNQNILHILLFQILLQELILKEKGYQPFWTPAYNELSEKLLSPIEIDCAVSDTIYLNTLLQNKAEQLQSSMMTSIKALNKNYQKTCFQLSTSTLVNKWEKEVIKSKVIKNLKVPLNLNRVQQKIINEWCNTSNYIYNKTLEKIKSGAKPNWMNLRDSLVISRTKKNSTEYKTSTDNNKIFKEKYNEVTNSIIHDINIEYKNVDKIKSNKIKLILEKFKKSREDDLKRITNNLNQERRNMVKNIKYEKNTNINTWELNTPKEVRTCAIKEVCNAYKTNFTLFKNGKCGYFNIKYRKKTKNEKCVSIPKSFLKIENDNNNKYIRIAPTFFKEKLEESDDIELNELESANPNSKLLIGKKTLKNNNLQMIEHDCKIIKQHNKWFILIPISVNINKKEKPINYCGIDPGMIKIKIKDFNFYLRLNNFSLEKLFKVLEHF